MRLAAPPDLPAIQAIYAHHVRHGLASFEEEGYGYCAPYRARWAYRYALEDSVYVRPDVQGRGVGGALLAELIRRCETAGYRQLVAIIGDSAHAASIALHVSQGFLRVGTLRSVGYKFGRWVDSVIMQRPLGRGDATPP